jgi:hypothetical protein
MMARVVACLMIGCTGLSGLLPSDPGPLTGQQLQAKYKQVSKEKVCAKAKRSKKTRELCKQWGMT